MVSASVVCAVSSAQTPGQKSVPKPRPEVQKLLDEGWRPDLNADASLDKFLSALNLATSLNDDCGRAAAQYGEGMCWQAKGNQRRAVDFFSQASQLQLRIGDLPGAADSLLYLGISETKVGEMKNAVGALDRAANLYHRLKQPGGEATCLNTIAGYKHNQGHDEEALTLFSKAETLAVLAHDTTTRIESLANVSFVYVAMGLKQNAYESAKQALALCTKDTPGPDFSFASEALATALRASGRTRDALAYFERARKIEHEEGNVSREAGLLGEIGAAETKLGRHAEAIGHLDNAYTLYQGMVDPALAAGILHLLADEYIAIGLTHKAQEYFMRAADAWKLSGDLRTEAMALARIAEIDLRQGNLPVAIWRLKTAVNIYQSVRLGQVGLDRRTRDSYRDQIAFVYRELADALVAEGRLGEARQVIDLLKDEEYFELLRGARKATEVDLSLVEREWTTKFDTVSARAVVAEQQVESEEANGEKADQVKLAGLRGNLKDANDAVSQFLKSAENAFASASANVDRLSDIKSSEDLVNYLHRRELRTYRPAAVYTLMTQDGVRLILALPSTRVMRSADKKVDAIALKRMILDFRTALTNPRLDPRPLGSQLYEILVRPIEATLKSTQTKTLLWSLDGALRYIPMWALYDKQTKQDLIEKYPSAVFMPSMIERMVREPSSDWSGSTFACTKGFQIEGETFPVLKNAGEEGRAVAELLKSKLYEGEDFNVNTLMQRMGSDTGVLHIVSHFRFQPADDERSYLVMGDGKPLTLARFSREFPQTEVTLLVLSACETAVGGDADGSEFEGFARLAQEKGAGAVIATLWPVADRSTSILMSNFYRIHVAHPNESKMQALRDAQLAMLNGDTESSPVDAVRGSVASNDRSTAPPFVADPKRPYAHPFYWAPFVLFGNWR